MKTVLNLFRAYPDTASVITGVMLLLFSVVWSGVMLAVIGSAGPTLWAIPGVLTFVTGGGMFMACIGGVEAELK